MRSSLVLLAPLLACGSSTSPRAPGNTTPTPAPAVTATLADDVAAFARAADLNATGRWTQRATFLGWTATNQAAFRLLICAEDPLDARGDYCDLDVCVADRASGAQVPELRCESAAAFEIYEPTAFDAATTTATAEAAIATLGALTDGTPGSIDDARLAIDNGTLVLAQGPRRVIYAPVEDLEEEEMIARATSVTADYVGTSPDGRCRVVLGRYTYRGWWEGVTGDIPRGFAAVTCD